MNSDNSATGDANNEDWLHFSIRSNGACPLCQLNNHCEIKEDLTETLGNYQGPEAPFEIVIYTCPHFVEIP